MTDLDPTAWRTLVLDADSQAGLCVVRSLGKRGVPVTAASDSRRSLGALSTYAEDAVVHQPPATAPAAFIDELVGVLEDGDYFAVIPVNDATTNVVSRAKARLEATGTTVGVPGWDRAKLAYDKARTFDIAASLSVPTPETHAPEGLDDVERLADDVDYPVVVKSRSKYVRDAAGRLRLHRVGDDSYADGPDALVATYRDVLATNDHLNSFPPLVQGYVPGETTTTVGLADDGDLLAWFQERRLRTTPHSGGNSTVITGMRDQRMRDYAAEVVDALEWTGPLQIEFMHTPDDEYYLIEVNGRYWGSVPLAVDSGVDVPWLHLCQLAGYTPTNPPVYREDVVHQRLLYGDIKWLGERLLDGHPSAIPAFLAAFGYARPVFLRPEDPLPSVAAPLYWAGQRAKKVWEKARDAWVSESAASTEGDVETDVAAPVEEIR
ncbi:ATP-grasp domain-containing protein [Haloarcula onubensis]|uniref:ATP-grasp domain-containing protein n=1 Tax=Haloarcula onubensis TaxID=2950539 RepID=A0ABU2FSF8_9EURY|nr:ATP-grasp domain-containing protein [Halomicroarcula sp. S3CR25-11]MDS0283704.1 ATP-grasp domain-containing protein [Halomicroarcula sp. S3CR25-11]